MSTICLKSRVISKDNRCLLEIPQIWAKLNGLQDNMEIFFILDNNRLQVQLNEPANTDIFEDFTEELKEKTKARDIPTMPKYGRYF